MVNVNEKQVGGNHYKTKTQPWDCTEEWGLGYLDGTALKYIARWRKKNGLEDIKKAIHFLEKLIEVETKKQIQKEAQQTIRFWELEGVQQDWVARRELQEQLEKEEQNNEVS